MIVNRCERKGNVTKRKKENLVKNTIENQENKPQGKKAGANDKITTTVRYTNKNIAIGSPCTASREGILIIRMLGI